MGYRTDYELTTDQPMQEKDWAVVKNELAQLTGYNSWEIDTEANDKLRLTDAKWYEHHTHMELFSAARPEQTWILYGVGEGVMDEHDEWEDTYHHGERISRRRVQITARWVEDDETDRLGPNHIWEER